MRFVHSGELRVDSFANVLFTKTFLIRIAKLFTINSPLEIHPAKDETVDGTTCWFGSIASLAEAFCLVAV
jgi:hypothetical protein